MKSNVTMAETKTCLKCNLIKPISKFPLKEGYISNECVGCKNIRQRLNWRRRNPIKSILEITHQVCTVCKQDKEISKFNNARNSKKGIVKYKQCKRCQGDVGKLWREGKLPAPTLIENLTCVYDGDLYVEEWKDIECFPQRHYRVSTFGRVKAMPSKYNRDEKLLKLHKQARDAYFLVKLTYDNVEKAKTLHRLVALAFHDNPENKPQVNHEDGIKLNNFYKNLSWVTAKENREHAKRMNLLNPSKGEQHYNCKLNKVKVLEIASSDQGCVALGKKYNVSPATIDQIKRGRSWRSVTGLKPKKKYDDDFIKTVNEIAYSDKSIKELCAIYGMGYWRVRDIKSGKINNRFTNKKKAA